MQFINPQSLLDCRDADYQPPTTADVKAAITYGKNELGIELKDLAAALNTTYQHLQKWQNGTPIKYCNWRVMLHELDLI